MKVKMVNKVFLISLWAFTFSAQAGGVISSPNVSNYESSQIYSEPPSARDPFTTSNRMYGEVGNQSAALAGNGQGFVAGFGPQKAPKMKLKGFVNRGSNKKVALLEVEGAGVYLVGEGDEIGLQAIGQNSVIKIIKIDSKGLRVQTGQVNQVIVVR